MPRKHRVYLRVCVCFLVGLFSAVIDLLYHLQCLLVGQHRYITCLDLYGVGVT